MLRTLVGVIFTSTLAFSAISSRFARAEEISVPIPLQVTLLSKIAFYLNGAERAGEDRSPSKELVLVPYKRDRAASESAADELARSILALPSKNGLAWAVERVPFTSADSLTKLIKERHASFVFFTPDFDEAELRAAGDGLADSGVLTLSALASGVGRGAALSFGLTSGRAQILLSLGQSKRLGIRFSSAFLQLAKVSP